MAAKVDLRDWHSRHEIIHFATFVSSAASVMAVAAPVTAIRVDGGNNLIRKCLPFSLDLSCPIALPSRASHVRPWPYAVA